MNNRAEIYSLITDIRGRLDELEGFVRALPGGTVPTPASYDEPGVETLTPEPYLEFRRTGFAAPRAVRPYDRPFGCYQVGAADAKLPIVFESFELSSLHKSGTEPAFGLQVTPTGQPQKWLTHEFLMTAAPLTGCRWVEWVLKISAAEPIDMVAQFFLVGPNLSEKISIPNVRVTEFAAFLHLRLGNEEMQAVAKGRDITEIRLLLGTGGKLTPIRLYNFSVFGKR